MRQSLILVAAALAAFGAGAGGSFHSDDYSILSDAALTSPAGWWQVWGRTRPLTYFTFWLNYRIGGANPIGYHAVNLALHVAAVLLLWRVLRRLISERAALMAALVFAVHPIQSEAVLYVFARAILLATVLALLAARAWLDGRRWIAAGWFALALAAKEEAVALPLVLLLIDWSRRKLERSSLLPAAAMLLLSLAAGLRAIGAAAAMPGSGAGAGAGLSPLAYFASQGWSILRYLRLLAAPWGFTIDPDIRVTAAWQAAAAWAAVVALIALAARRFTGLRAGLWVLCGLVLLTPSSSVFPAADLAADRRMYLPATAFAVAAGLMLERFSARYVAALAAALALLSVGRTQVWRTEESLWSEAVRRSPRKVRPKLQLARALDPASRLPLLEEARGLAPEDPRVAAEIGRTKLELARPAEALTEFGRALALSPRDPQALNNRGAALLALGQTDAAWQDFDRALAIDPCQFEARLNLRRLGVTAPPPARCRFTPEQRKLLE